MEKRKGKISSREVFALLVVIIYSPAVRLFAQHASEVVGKAGWLVPLVAIPAYLYLIRQLHYMLNAYTGLSLLQIYEKITSTFIGKIIAIIHLLWIINITAFSLNYFAERLIVSVYPNIVPSFFILTLLLVVAIVVRAGLVISTRMINICFWLISGSFLLIIFILIPRISLENIYPVTYLDILPLLQCSIVIIAILSYISLISILSNNIKDIKNFKKVGKISGIILFVIIITILLTSIGTIGDYILSKTNHSFLMAVGQIILLDNITGFESLLVTTWILSDFALPVIFTFVAMKTIKYIFNLKDASIFTNVFLVLLYYATILTARSVYELNEFYTKFGLYVNFALCFVFPIIMSWILALRIKAKEMLAKGKKSNVES